MEDKKFQITLNEKQARLLSWSLDQFMRLIVGQDWSFQELMESAWEKRCKEATGKPMDKEWDGGWQAMREDAERICKEIKQRFWGLAWNELKGIHYDDSADTLFDMHQVIRHALWKSQPEPKSHWTVDAFRAMQVGKEPLITMNENGWISVEDSLPEVDEEVIVLTDDDGMTHPCPMMIAFAHLVDKGATITIKRKPYKIESYNGWNIPGVKFWMPCPEIPNND